jgi:hypothetical protein
MSLFVTFLFLFSLADVQRSDPEITMKQKIIREKEGKVKRIKTINESRMDIIGEMPQLRAMLDIRAFLSTLSSGWKSTRAHEMEKHNRYVTHTDGRRCTNMKLYVAVRSASGRRSHKARTVVRVVAGVDT